MRDPGLTLRTTPLPAAFSFLRPGSDSFPLRESEPDAAVQALADAAGMRARKVLLDGEWWAQAAVPMLARVADRRQAPRPDEPALPPDAAGGMGWVALLPAARGGYRMLGCGEQGDGHVEWKVDAEVASRLAPFAFAFHERFAARALGAGDMLRFALRHGARDLGLLLLAGFTAALVGLLTPIATARLIDHAIPAGSPGEVGSLVAGLAVAAIALLALDVVRTLAVLRFESRIGVAMQAAIVDRVVSAPARFFRGFSSGDLSMRMGSVNTVQRTLTGSTIASFVTSAFLLANVAVMLAYSVPLTLASAGIVLLVAGVSATLGALRLRIGPRIEALDGKLAAMTYEIFAGISKIRAAAAEARVMRQWDAKYEAFRQATAASARLSNREAVALSALQPAATLLVLALAWSMSRAGSGLTAGAFVAFHAALFALLAGVHGLVSTALDVVNLRPVWERAKPILETPPEDAAGGTNRIEPRGAICLEDVGFAYPGGPGVLDGVRLAIAGGEFVAIVGASGSGKSTLLRLLLGFEAPSSGRVLYDGIDLAELDLRHLRARIGTVLQGGKLWAGDLLTNILGASGLGTDAAWHAARQAGLAEDIEAMPMGLYTMVGEGLSTLSGGQRQRLLIARALVGRPRILLLDEATSALDNLSQARVLESLAALQATRVVIAHRLSTVRGADRIVVLDQGRIVQQGTFRELAAARGAFAAMLARQEVTSSSD